MTVSASTGQRGFTLIEVLVAFFLLALAVTATLRLTSKSIDLSGQLRARLLADWVVQDRLEEHRAMRNWFPPGTYEGVVSQAGTRFRWREVVSPTPVGRFRRIEVSVSSETDPETALARQVGYLSSPN